MRIAYYRPESKEYVLNILKETNIIYLSMEIGLCEDIHTYSGGLGILAGDTLHSAADLGKKVAGITLIHRQGYFQQTIHDNRQHEKASPWDVEQHTVPIPEGRAVLTLRNREVIIEPRLGILVGEKKHIIPILFLDTNLEENHPDDKTITDTLYAPGQEQRILQEAILGIGAKKVLRALNCKQVHTYHMNEGHAAFAPLEDVHYLGKYYGFNKPKIHELVRSGHVFTTHTPVPAGHDTFSNEQLNNIFHKDYFAWNSIDLAGHNECNMTKLALNLSRYVNAVAKKHGEVTREMFPGYAIQAITNGVHLATWIHPQLQAVLDKQLPSWRLEPGILEHSYTALYPEQVVHAHEQAKQELLEFIKETTGRELDQNKLTIGFARRFAPYKRADLIFKDIKRLKEIGQDTIQIVFSGEAHPQDHAGKELLTKVLQYAQELQGSIDVVFIPGYDMGVAKKLIAGCDLWLNNPVPPQEASGTSGMKACANATPNLSTLDGWWIEGITKRPLAGWIIDHREDGRDEISLYEQLDHITTMYYTNKARWREHMLHALSLAHYFNTHRMVQEYEEHAWTNKIY